MSLPPNSPPGSTCTSIENPSNPVTSQMPRTSHSTGTTCNLKNCRNTTLSPESQVGTPFQVDGVTPDLLDNLKAV
jgi:hypothetical protein